MDVLNTQSGNKNLRIENIINDAGFVVEYNFDVMQNTSKGIIPVFIEGIKNCNITRVELDNINNHSLNKEIQYDTFVIQGTQIYGILIKDTEKIIIDKITMNNFSSKEGSIYGIQFNLCENCRLGEIEINKNNFIITKHHQIIPEIYDCNIQNI